MTSRRARTKDLAGSGHLETFCDRFAGLAASDRLRHRARKLTAVDPLTTSYFGLGDLAVAKASLQSASLNLDFCGRLRWRSLRLQMGGYRLCEPIGQVGLGEKEMIFFAFEFRSEKLGAITARKDNLQAGFIHDERVRQLPTGN